MNIKKVLKPVKATVAATGSFVGVLTNPFHEHPRSFSRRYHNGMILLNDPLSNLWQEVRDCPDCNEPIDHNMHRAGYETMYTHRILTRDTHCVKHWDQVAEYQEHYRQAHR